jgi:hypothetical protein
LSRFAHATAFEEQRILFGVGKRNRGTRGRALGLTALLIGLLGVLPRGAKASDEKRLETDASIADSDSPKKDKDACIPADQCCKICDRGRACGNSCIHATYRCHKGRGCACNAEEVCQ